MKYAFIRAHRDEFGVRAMCRVLRVHFSGFYTWLKNPLSHRAQEDIRQTELIRQAWADSGKVYGYRKLTDDLRDQGERISENRGPWPGSPRRSATGAALAATAGSQPSWQRTGWSSSSRHLCLTKSGSPTSHISRPTRVGCTYALSSTCSRAVWWDGPPNPA